MNGDLARGLSLRRWAFVNLKQGQREPPCRLDWPNVELC